MSAGVLGCVSQSCQCILEGSAGKAGCHKCSECCRADTTSPYNMENPSAISTVSTVTKASKGCYTGHAISNISCVRGTVQAGKSYIFAAISTIGALSMHYNQPEGHKCSKLCRHSGTCMH